MKTRKILLLILVLLIAGAVVGYRMWNKPHQDVADAAAVKADAAALYQSFSSDSTGAKKTYLQKVVQVTGVVNAVSSNQQKQAVITLKTAADGAYINCTMEGPVNNVQPGTRLSVKGICSGLGEGDVDLGIMGDVYLVRCYVAQ